MTRTSLQIDHNECAVSILSAPSPVARAARGALAGLTATFPMTIVMSRLYPILPARERHPLPPRHITEKLAGESGLAHGLDEGGMKAVTLASHFAYGAASGSLFGLLAGFAPRPLALSGVVYGLLVWAISYLGWLPATGVLPDSRNESARRNGLMIAAHVVWGGVTGALTGLLPGHTRSPIRHET